MNKSQLEGAWHELKGKAKEKWGELTDEDLSQIEGKAEKLSGTLQKKYGYTKEKAEEEVNSFLHSVKKDK